MNHTIYMDGLMCIKEGDKGYDHIPFGDIEVMYPHIYHGFYCANVELSTTTYRIG